MIQTIGSIIRDIFLYASGGDRLSPRVIAYQGGKKFGQDAIRDYFLEKIKELKLPAIVIS